MAKSDDFDILFPCTGKVPFCELHQDELETIFVDQPEATLRDKAIQALNRANDGSDIPILFQRGGILYSAVWDENCHPSLKPVSRGFLQYLIGRSANWMKRTKNSVASCSPPPNVLTMILEASEYPFPELKHLVMVPGMRADGTIHNARGYDRTSGRLFYPACDEKDFRPVADIPSQSDIVEAFNIINLVLGVAGKGFPFVDQADKANALAMLMTPLIRPMFKGVCPLFIITALAPGSGKTLLASLAQNIYGIDSARTWDVPENIEEFKKTVQTAVKTGHSIVLLDNLDFALKSGAMCSMLTAQEISFRILGRHDDINVPNEFLFQITGNNVQVLGDLQRRVVEIRLDAKRHDPWNRGPETFSVDLPGWAIRERNQIVWALLVLARHWVVSGCPDPQSDLAINSTENFGDWARVVGGILENVGITSFLANRKETLGRDMEPFEWGAFLREIRGVFDSYPFTTKELTEKLQSLNGIGSPLYQSVPNSLGPVTYTNFAMKLGKAFALNEGVRYPNTSNILVRGKERENRTLWSVQSPNLP